MNKAIFVGRMTADADVRYSADNNAIARFTLAVDRKYKRDNEPTADFITCVAFGKTAEFIEKYFSKGKKIGLTGHIQTGSYTNKDGAKVYTTDVIVEECEFVESKADAPSNDAPRAEQKASDGFMNIPDDIQEELPFA